MVDDGREVGGAVEADVGQAGRVCLDNALHTFRESRETGITEGHNSGPQQAPSGIISSCCHGAEVRPIPPTFCQTHPKFLNIQALLFSHFVVGPQTFCGREALLGPTVNESIPWDCEKISESVREEEEQKEKQLLVSEHNQNQTEGAQ